MSWIIAGGGFRGMVAAFILRERGEEVTLVEAGSGLGRVLRSREWNGLALDLGCHLFENHSERAFTVMSELAGKRIRPIKVRYGAMTEGRMTDEVAVPDYSAATREELKTFVWESLNAPDSEEAAKAADLAEYFTASYGPSLGSSLSNIARKIFQVEPDSLHWHSVSSCPLQRIRIAPDDISMRLKRIPRLDARLAVSSVNRELMFLDGHAKSFPHKNFYPSAGGLLEFCNSAKRCLESMAATIVLGEKIESLDIATNEVSVGLADGRSLSAKKLLWCLDPPGLGKLMGWPAEQADIHVPVPMVLFYFLVPATAPINFNYFHDYSVDSHSYRISTAGDYGQQVNEAGLSYLCCECPTTIGSAMWDNPDEFAASVWQEVLQLGIVNVEAPSDHTCMKTPVSYKGLRRDYESRMSDFESDVAAFDGRLLTFGLRAFAKVDIVSEFDGLL